MLISSNNYVTTLTVDDAYLKESDWRAALVYQLASKASVEVFGLVDCQISVCKIIHVRIFKASRENPTIISWVIRDQEGRHYAALQTHKQLRNKSWRRSKAAAHKIIWHQLGIAQFIPSDPHLLVAFYSDGREIPIYVAKPTEAEKASIKVLSLSPVKTYGVYQR